MTTNVTSPCYYVPRKTILKFDGEPITDFFPMGQRPDEQDGYYISISESSSYGVSMAVYLKSTSPSLHFKVGQTVKVEYQLGTSSPEDLKINTLMKIGERLHKVSSEVTYVELCLTEVGTSYNLKILD